MALAANPGANPVPAHHLNGEGAPALPKSAEALYYEVAMMRLRAQLAQVDTIDAKASTVLSIGSTILPITASLLVAEQDLITESTVAKVGLVVGAVVYVALVVVFVLAYRLSQWGFRPELTQ